MLKRLALVATGLLLFAAAPAAAQQYPPAEDTLTLSDSTVTVGQEVTASASTFEPGSSVAFEINPPLGSATADVNGVATLTFTVPDLAPGDHTVTASGTGTDGAPLTVSATLTIVGESAGAGGAGGGPLPATGNDSSVPLARIGAVLLAGGALAVLAARKRRSTAIA